MKKIENGPLRDHSFDGIQEYDNPMPLWWLGTFFLTIIFSFLYWIHYEFGGGITQWQEVQNDLKVIQKSNSTKKSWTEDQVLALAASQTDLDTAKVNFENKCSACHGKNLEGLIGPNLTDNFWIHGKGLALDIATVVQKGVADKGMPPWEGLLQDKEIMSIAAYIHSKIGSNPSNAKPPEGVKIGP